MESDRSKKNIAKNIGVENSEKTYTEIETEEFQKEDLLRTDLAGVDAIKEAVRRSKFQFCED